MTPKPDFAPTRRVALKFAVGYGLLGLMWVVVSGWSLRHLRHDDTWEFVLETTAGCFFVLVTAGLIGGWLDRYFGVIRSATEKLRQSEAGFQAIFQRNPEAIGICRQRDGVLIDVNEAFARLTGYPRAEIIGRTGEQLRLWPAGHPRLMGADQPQSPGGIEVPLRTRHGDLRSVLASLQPIDLAGEPCLLGTLIDVTERKQAEAAVRESEERLRTLGDNIPGGALYQLLMPADGKNRYTYVSAGFERIFGLPAERILADPAAFWDLIVAEDRARLHEEEARCARLGADFDHEFRQRTVSGELKWLRARATPRPNGDGALLWDGVVTDITDRKRLEASLLESEQRYTLLFQKSSTPTVLLKLPEVVIVDINEACEHLIGFTRQEVVGRTAVELGLAKKDKRDDVISHFHRGLLESFEVSLVTKSGATRVVLTHTNGVIIGGQPHAITTLQDVTALKQAETALRRSEVHLRTLVKTLPDLVWLKDPAGVYLACNARFERFFGAPEATIVGKTDYDFVNRELADLFRANDDAALAAGRPRIYEEEVTYASDGHREILETIKTPMRDADGRLIGVLGIGRDITVRRQNERQLQASEHALREAQRIAGLGKWEWDVRSDRHTWSDRVYEIYGLNPALPPLGYPALRDYFTPESWTQLSAAVAQARQNGAAYECDVELVRADGTHRWITFRGEALRDAAGAITQLRGTVQDITARKQVEEALRESEVRRTLALDAAKAGIWEWELATGNNRWSDELWKLYGLDPHSWEPSYEAWRESVHPEDRAQLEQTLQEAVQREAEINLEWRVHNSGADPRWLMSRGRPLRDATGRVTRYLGVVFEITERRRAEEAARQSAARLDFALQASHTGAWSLNPQNRTATRTLIHAQIFGYADPNGKWNLEQFMAHIVPEDREAVRQHIQAGMAHRTNWNFECRIRRVGGELRWIFIAGGFEPGTQSPLVTGIIQDITERKQAEAELLQTRNTLLEAQRVAHLGSFEYIAATQTTRWSEEEYRIYGLDPAGPSPAYEDMLARCIHPEDAALLHATFMQAMQSLTIYELEHRIVRPDGSVRWVHDRAQPYLDAQGKLVRYVGTTLDITERKQLEAQRALMEAQLRQQQKLEAIGTLASGVAHEINNPISGIMIYAQLIQDRLPAASPLIEFTGEIMHETKRVATIVRNLLTFARNEKQSHSPARLIDIVEAVLSLVRTVIGRDQIVLHLEVPADLPPFPCRNQQIQQVIMNLVTNARDALNERYPGAHPDKVLRLSAQLRANAGRRWIRLTVEDHGTGIPPAVRDRIFDPFFTTKGRDSGTGLGLSISHGIVKEHDGEWTVESEPGQFTRMHIDLPVDPQKQV